MKRKAECDESESPVKRRQSLPPSIETAFRPGLFDDATRSDYSNKYASSVPYLHAVVPSLIEDSLLRGVRDEIREHIHFTLKETDIYRIHQSGDLANLSNLDLESLKHLPNLVRLRDALYSPEFRLWIGEVTGEGKLSGSKTDMAVNVYTPGSYLLCHDDVIGSRKVSYILYLTDPDLPWKPEWGGGLRLFPTETRTSQKGEDVKVPMADHSMIIPPSFGQLSFFAVRPGESYHDVEEVYYPQANEQDQDGGRIRMAISGWFHVPQEGEDGFEAGVEQTQAQNSSLAQLKGAANEFDEPQTAFRHYGEARLVMDSHARDLEIDPGDDSDPDEDILTEQDLTFLLQYISPSYLTPQMAEEFALSFVETSVLQLETFFKEPFAQELAQYVTKSDQSPPPPAWGVARPPHKQRYCYLQGTESLHGDQSPISRVLTDLLHSHAFKKWLALVTGLRTSALLRQNVLARRFRRGKDYALASSHNGRQMQLEFTIGMTTSTGWVKDEVEAQVETNESSIAPADQNEMKVSTSSQPEFGGEEIYMAGDEEDSGSTASQSKLPQVGKKTDPAVYKSVEDDEDDGILFTDVARWNVFSVVLRDRGTLRFVKYVSRAATGDRWDIKGEVELSDDAFDEEAEKDLFEFENDPMGDPYERARLMEEGSDEDEAIDESDDDSGLGESEDI
jgi:Rps23 Pro-64 3,4-dihydroxylase Tpa1-like proline 4-hydroxylase